MAWSGPLSTLYESSSDLLNILSFLHAAYDPKEIVAPSSVGLTFASYPWSEAASVEIVEELAQFTKLQHNRVECEEWLDDPVSEAALGIPARSLQALQETFDLVVTLLSAAWPFIAIGTVVVPTKSTVGTDVTAYTRISATYVGYRRSSSKTLRASSLATSSPIFILKSAGMIMSAAMLRRPIRFWMLLNRFAAV